MKLFDMKRPAVKERLSAKSVGKLSPDPYSYDHKITLDDDALTKLGIATPKVGDKFHIMAHGTVTSVNAHSSADGGNERRVGVQLKRMGAQKLDKSSALGAVDKGIADATED